MDSFVTCGMKERENSYETRGSRKDIDREVCSVYSVSNHACKGRDCDAGGVMRIIPSKQPGYFVAYAKYLGIARATHLGSSSGLYGRLYAILTVCGFPMPKK